MSVKRVGKFLLIFFSVENVYLLLKFVGGWWKCSFFVLNWNKISYERDKGFIKNILFGI